MLNIEQIADWRGQDIFDKEGERLGKLDEVYYERASGEALLASVKSGLLGRRGALVPLAGASAGRDYVRVAYGADQVKGTEAIDITETLSAEALTAVRSTYDVELPDGAQLEAATLVEERRAAARVAIEHADQLEHQAVHAADVATDARARAADAQAAADDAERDALALREEASEARATAETARRDAGLAPANSA